MRYGINQSTGYIIAKTMGFAIKRTVFQVPNLEGTNVGRIQRIFALFRICSWYQEISETWRTIWNSSVKTAKKSPVFPCRREKTGATYRVDFVLDGFKRYQNGTAAPFPRLYLHLRCSKSPCFQGFLDQAKAFKTYSHSMVATGLGDKSYNTRLHPLTSLRILSVT